MKVRSKWLFRGIVLLVLFTVICWGSVLYIYGEEYNLRIQPYISSEAINLPHDSQSFSNVKLVRLSYDPLSGKTQLLLRVKYEDAVELGSFMVDGKHSPIVMRTGTWLAFGLPYSVVVLDTPGQPEKIVVYKDGKSTQLYSQKI